MGIVGRDDCTGGSRLIKLLAWIRFFAHPRVTPQSTFDHAAMLGSGDDLLTEITPLIEIDGLNQRESKHLRQKAGRGIFCHDGELFSDGRI